MQTCCIAYTTDTAYMFPTFVSAAQARRHASRAAADVVVYCTGLDRDTERAFSRPCLEEGVELVYLAPHQAFGSNAMMSRLFLNEFVPSKYTQYLYMDGDIQITGSLDPLVSASVPPNHFLAANDPLTFQIEDMDPQSNKLRRHLSHVGFDAERRLSYFNSGVLRINRTGWDVIGQKAWEQYLANPNPNRFPDQDALNLAAAERRLPMSLRWNFPMFLRNSRVEEAIKPRIHHFMSSPKPWHGRFPPWTQAFCQPYDQLITRYPELASFRERMGPYRRALYHLQQRRKVAMETLMWGFSDRRSRILEYEAGCAST